MPLLTNQNLPLALGGLGHLVGCPHLRVGHAPNDKHDEPWATAVLCGRLILVPVSKPCTATEGKPYIFYIYCMLIVHTHQFVRKKYEVCSV